MQLSSSIVRPGIVLVFAPIELLRKLETGEVEGARRRRSCGEISNQLNLAISTLAGVASGLSAAGRKLKNA
jgi:hypothetical protein